MNSLVPFCRWLQNTSWALAISGSLWAYPFVQMIHFTGLSLWVGTCLALDFRLLGAGKRLTISELCDALFFWNWVGLGVAIVAGFGLFSASAEGYIVNLAFLIKVGLLIPAGVIWHIVVQRKARSWSQSPGPPAAAKVAGLVEALLWLSVITAAVSIPYASGPLAAKSTLAPKPAALHWNRSPVSAAHFAGGVDGFAVPALARAGSRTALSYAWMSSIVQ